MILIGLIQYVFANRLNQTPSQCDSCLRIGFSSFNGLDPQTLDCLSAEFL